MKTELHLGDNLEYMKSLESNSIDLIYCDILYGTGQKRNFIGCDINPKSIEITKERLKNINKIQDLKNNDIKLFNF